MKKEEIKPISHVVFKEILKERKEFQGRVFSLYEPVRGKKGEYIIFLLDEKTGLGAPMILPPVELALIDKPVIVRIMNGVMDSIHVAIKKQGDKEACKQKGYFKKNPVNAGKQHGEFSHEEKIDDKGTVINHYVFKSIITDKNIIV